MGSNGTVLQLSISDTRVNTMTDKETIEYARFLLAQKYIEAMENDSSFCEQYIKIVNKQGEQVPFTYNTIQKKIDNKIKELELLGKPARIIILKARQEGVSTYTQAKILCRACKEKNRNALVVAHRDDATSNIFEKAKYMYECLPEDIQPLQRASNAKELVFNTPTHYRGNQEGLNNKIKVQTAGSGGIGRSDTYYYVHLSEFAWWEGKEDKSPSKQLSGLLQAVPDIQGTFVVIESTANGYNDFKDQWDAAVKGENDFIPMFFPWHAYEEYQMDIGEDEKNTIMSSLSEYEQGLVNSYNITAEQIQWYRWTLKNKCSGDINLMKQENPSSPEEAFIMTGSPIFNNEKVMARLEYLRKKYEQEPPKRGYFYFEWNNPDIMDIPKPDTIRWTDSKTGCIQIYEDVKPNYPYAIGGDTKGSGADFFTLTCKNNNTGKRCATLHSQGKSKDYTAQAYCMGYYFNQALIGIEINFNTYPIELLTDWHYPRQYVRQRINTFDEKMQNEYGWKTDGNTRPTIIEREITLIEENIEQFTDIGFLQECLTFIDKHGRADAMDGKHDDILFSDMICEAVGEQQRHGLIVEKASIPMNIPSDLREDLENDPEALKHWLTEHST